MYEARLLHPRYKPQILYQFDFTFVEDIILYLLLKRSKPHFWGDENIAI